MGAESRVVDVAFVHQEGDETSPKRGVVVDLTKGPWRKYCVWAITGTAADKAAAPACPLKPLTRYTVRLVYECVAPSAYSLTGDVDGKLASPWSQAVMTCSKQLRIDE